jgi:hypothetical protein
MEVIALNPQTGFSALETVAADVESVRGNVNVSVSVLSG